MYSRQYVSKMDFLKMYFHRITITITMTITITITMTIIIVIIILSLFLTQKEHFKPSNLFEVEKKEIDTGIQKKFPISDQIDVDTTLFLEQNKLTFDLKNTVIELINKRLNSTVLKVFDDSLEKIFMDTDFKNLVAYVTVYDSKNFYAYKLKIHITSNEKITKNTIDAIVKIQPLKFEEISNIKPNEGVLTPNYYRILNTLHLLDPFLTSASVNFN